MNLLRFDDTGYTLSGNLITLTNPGAGGGIELTVAGTATISNSIDNKANTQLDFVTVAGGTINATGVLSSSNNKDWGVSGGGVTIFSGNNTFTRALTIYNGATLIVTSNNALGTTATGTTVLAGGTLAFAGNVNYATTEQILLQGGTVNNDSGTNTFAGTIAMSIADGFIGATAGTLTMSGVISGGFNLTKNGAGTNILTASNTYTGTTTVSAGTLIVGSNNALGTNAGGTSVTAGASLGIQGGINYSTTEALTLNGAGLAGVGAFYNVSGNNTFSGAITLASDSTIGSATAGNTLTATAGINTAGFVLTTDGAGNITESGVISGTGDLVKNGTGTLQLSGAANNTFTGTTTVNVGTLQLNKTAGVDAILGPLVIGNDDGTANNDVVRLLAANQIADTSAVTVTSSGLLALNNFAETIGGLSMNSGSTSGASVTTGTATLTLGGDVALNVFGTGASGATISGGVGGTLALGATRTFTIANGTAAQDLTVSTIISGAGFGITKDGAGTLQIAGTASNTNNGTTTVNAGVLELNKTATLNAIAGPLVVGDGAGGASADVVRLLASDQILNTQTVTVRSSGLLDLNGFNETISAATALTMETGAASGAAVTTGAGTLTLGGNVLLNTVVADTVGATISGNVSLNGAVRTFTVNDSNAVADLSISAVISNGSLTKQGAGTLVLSGANTYAGATLVSAGVLNVQNPTALGTTAAGTTVNAGATIQIQGNTAIGAEALTLSGTGTTALPAAAVAPNPGALESVSGTNSWAGNVTLAAASSIGVTAGQLTLSGVISGAPALTKAGAGTLRLTGANTLAGSTTITAGTLLANNAAGSATGTGAVTVQNTTTLGGTGAITGPITVQNGGTLSPGDGGTEDLNVGALTMQAGSTFAAEINSGVASTGYDQVIASGAVALGNSTLSISLGYVPADADVITLINNTGAGAIGGTFNGYAEGGTVLVGTEAFQISYVGGTGNDVVLRPQPRVINVTSTKANGTYGSGEVIDVTVQFNRVVNVTGTPQLTLETGTSDAVVNYFSGSGTDTLTFRYTVAVGHASADLDYLSTAALALNGGTIKSAPGIDAYLVLAAPGAAGSLGFNKNVVIISFAQITARETVDADGDGRIDAIRIVTDVNLNDNFTGLTITVGGYILAAVPYDTGGTANDNEFFVRLVEAALPPDTGDTNVTPTVTVTASGSLGLQTDAGVAATDKAKPVLLASIWNNIGSGDGVDAGDTVTLTFSELVTTVSLVVATDIGLPVTNDTWAASTVADQGPATTIDIVLAGAMRLTPAGTYSVAALTAGSPTGVFIADGTRIRDGAAVFNTTLNQGFGTAVDLRPGGRIISIVWANTHTFERRAWDVDTDADYGATYRASTSAAPPALRVANSGSGRQRFDISCAISEPSGWNLAVAAGIDLFEMKVDPTPPSAFSLDLATGPKQLAGQLYSGQESSFDLQLVTPTEITTGADIEQSITITIIATQD